MNVGNWVIPERDAHVCVLEMLDRGISSIEVIVITLDHNVVLAKLTEIQNKTKMSDLGQFMSIQSRTQSCMTRWNRISLICPRKTECVPRHQFCVCGTENTLEGKSEYLTAQERAPVVRRCGAVVQVGLEALR